MVMLTAALRLLHARYGKPCYVLGADAWAADVYRGWDDVARCWSLPRKSPTLFGLAWPGVLRAYARARPVPFTFSSITRGRRAASVVCFASAASTRAGARSSMKHPGRSLRGSKRCCVSQGERRLRCVRPITPSPRFSADGRRSFAFRRRNVRSATAGCAHTAIRASRCSCSGALPPRCRCSNPSARLQCCRAAPTARPSRGLGGPPEA